MGLAIETGVLAYLLKHDQEGAEWVATTLEGLNRVLVKHGLPAHDEPRELPAWWCRGECGSFPYSFLHFLRRAIAFSRQNPAEFSPAPAGWEPMSDPYIDRELTVFMDAHTICHSDSQGFYVPLDFDIPIYSDAKDKVVGDIVGSTYRARKELVAVAPLLGIELDGDELSDAQAVILAGQQKPGTHPLWIERLVWFSFFEATTASLRYKTAIVFH